MPLHIVCTRCRYTLLRTWPHIAKGITTEEWVRSSLCASHFRPCATSTIRLENRLYFSCIEVRFDQEKLKLILNRSPKEPILPPPPPALPHLRLIRSQKEVPRELQQFFHSVAVKNQFKLTLRHIQLLCEHTEKIHLYFVTTWTMSHVRRKVIANINVSFFFNLKYLRNVFLLEKSYLL